MAHSGTTILTHTLQTHPSIVCCIGGTERWLLENEWLSLEQGDEIRMLLRRFPDQQVLLKRPWAEIRHAEFLAKQMPKARFIYCYRGFDDTAESWRQEQSMVDSHLRDSDDKCKRQHYDMYWSGAKTFAAQVTNCYWHDHDAFVANPIPALVKLAEWLGVAPTFDPTLVGTGIDIKELLAGRFLRAGSYQGHH